MSDRLPRRYCLRPIDGLDLPPLNHRWYGRLFVNVDGKTVTGVVGVDADQGYVIAYSYNYGTPVITKNGQPVLRSIKGRVEIHEDPFCD